MLAHVATSDPGKTWVAPITFAGNTEVRVDGEVLRLEKRVDKPGGTGQYMDLSRGLHRLEIYCWSPSGSAPGGGLMTLTWKTPKTSAGEMGGIRPHDLRLAGTPMWASRKLHHHEIVRSGHVSIDRVESRDGGPVAGFKLAGLENFWFGGESPIFAYRLTARKQGNPADTRYSWSFGGGSEVERPSIQWLFEDGADRVASLTAQSGDKRSSCKVPFYPFTTIRSSLNGAASRERYLSAALDVFTAHPADVDPTANWSASHWNNFFRSLDLDKGNELLTHIVNVRWDSMVAKLPPERLGLLQEFCLSFAPRVSPQMALKWIGVFKETTRGNNTGKVLMDISRAEVMMYYLDELDRAKDILEGISRARPSDEVGELARIRLGDIAFLAGDLNEAMKLYGEVQGRSKHNAPSPAAGSGFTRKPASRLSGSGLARSKSELEARRDEGSPDRTRLGGRSFAMRRNTRIDEWKMDALHDVSAAETVKSLIKQDFLLEARDALQSWEREFPLSKITGDYIIHEAKFYMDLEDWQRAHTILAAYCEQVDASSYLAQAVGAILKCKEKLKAPDAEVIAFCDEMKGKLKYHPSAMQKIKDQLRWRKRD